MTSLEDNEEEEKNSIKDVHEVIDRLIAEQNQTRKIINDAKRALYSDSEFDGLTLVGGIKSLLRRYREERNKVEKLNRELDQIVKNQVAARKRREN